ncbi:hypothetical protein N7474_008076 [Penicillium riverlandense]|uniref:uncharacterized protein n=1 Tax=Penicillium riverlandense TaxID=1903569 RepID=UPI0025487AEE|nr:uncharacterized protein N7474_008076 [Penicillium riverlandense]KAJ5811775.1 hypothetical protein N7474_008076 [Penicillium riverlandense]
MKSKTAHSAMDDKDTYVDLQEHVMLEELEDGRSSGGLLKYSKKGILLDPQPSDYPHDPLNFSHLEKGRVLIGLAYWAFLGTANLIIITPAFFEIAANYNTSLESVAYTVNGPLIAYGAGCLLWVPIGNLIGVRLSFLISAFGAATLSIWAALAPTFPQFVAARVLASLFFASPEAYGPQIVTDTFFLHQRAASTSVFTAFQFCGFTFAGFIGGYAAMNHGWRAPSWAMVIMSYIAFMVVAFIFPETTFTRSKACERDAKRRYIHTFSLSPGSGGGPPKSSSLWRSFAAPWKYVFHPTVMLATIFFSLFLATNDYLLTSNSIVYPTVYGSTLEEVALTSFAPTTGCLLGILIGGWANDKYVAWQMTRNTEGVFIPEMRLSMAIITVILGPAGLVLFGTAAQYRLHWIVPLLGELMVNLALVIAGNITYTYMADVYQERTDQVLVMLNALKNLSAFGLVYAVTPWNTHSGYSVAFGCLAVILFAAHLPLVLLYYRGAKMQTWETKKFPVK